MITLAPERWVDVIRTEYLSHFIPDGGAAVKFVVGTDATSTARVKAALAELAEEGLLVHVAVDAATTRAHMIDHVFHAIARQLDWVELARSFVRNLLKSHGYQTPVDRSDLSCRSVAHLNHREESLLRTQIMGWLETGIYRDYAMSQQFRLAMIRLCMSQLDPATAPVLARSLLEWLRGELGLISALKQALIFERITRKNARHMLSSLSHWLKVCGRGGLVVVMDISRYTRNRRIASAGDGLYYSVSAVIDGHEVLRQMIDGADELESCLVVVMAAPEFLTDYRRGINCYDALRLRIADEVHDRARTNPFASLVCLGVGD